MQAIELHTAADMYGVERLKATCESILVKGLHVENVAGLFALADENRCVRACKWRLSFFARLKALLIRYYFVVG